MGHAVKAVSVAVTEGGRRLAQQLPYPRLEGSAAEALRARWHEVDGFVLFLATGAAVRLVAPLLGNKRLDPAVVCVDEAGRYVVSLLGGHARGANDLARDVAVLLGAEAVVTTATDAAGITPLDALPGFTATGDIAGVTTAMLDGRAPRLLSTLPWPAAIRLIGGDGPTRVIVTDRDLPSAPGTVLLHPPSLVVGVGTSSDARPEEVGALVEEALVEADLARASVAVVATIDRRRGHPAVTGLGLPVRAFDADRLAAVDVPTPSEAVDAAVGTPSVCEAAALLAAGRDAELVVTKHKNAVATVAVARRARPPGRLSLVGLGPGGAQHRTPAAVAAVRSAEIVVGYAPYVEQCRDLLGPQHVVVRSPIGDEVDRARAALDHAALGRRVALVCSGDAGVYAMASIALELAEGIGDVEVEVVPGVTAAVAAAAALGAPLAHDHVAISLSDLLTPWDAIERRLHAAAEGDFVVSLYNPRSQGRPWQLGAARDILLARRPPATPVGIVADATRPAERVELTTLADLDVGSVDMTTCVIVGASTTRVVDGRMVTPRGYQP